MREASKKHATSGVRSLRVLIVEDQPADAELAIAWLKRAGYSLSFEIVETLEQFKDRIERSTFDLILSDHNLRTWTGTDVLECLGKSGKEVPFIVVTGTLGDEAAVEYIKQGAADYVLKHRLERLPVAVGRALREKAQCEESARLQEAVFAGKREWELTFDQVPDAVFLLDEYGCVRRANRAAAEVLSMDFKQMIGQPWYEMIHGLGESRPDDPHLQEVLDMGEGLRKDIGLPRLGKVFEVVSSPLRDSAGGLCGAVVVMRDVTERRRGEEALVRLRKAVDASGEVVFMTDPTGVFTFVNPEFTRLYGYSEEEVVGKVTPRVLKSGRRSAEEYANFWKTILENRGIKEEVSNKTKDGRLVDAENSVNSILDEQGDIKGYLAIQRDITERKRLLEQLRQSQKMDAIGQLAGGVAHDFNNLLTIISGYGELVSSGLGPDHPHQGHVKEIQQAADRASGLTRQLLAFGRRQVLAPQILDLNAVLSNIDKMLHRLIGEDIEMETLAAVELGRVKADAGQIEQIIMNLAVNARDAMPTGGKLNIETANVILDETYAQGHISVKPGSYVMLAVSDNGYGMDAETQARIFEPFFTTKALGKGTGLGLATVYGIVKQSGGHIWVYSEPGKGSTFKIYFPRVEGTVSRTSKVQIISRDRRGTETVLVVEDEETIRQLVRSILESNGYRVLEAKSGADALSICYAHSGAIHLVLTDVVMPQMSGPELALQWAARRPETKIIYMSGYTNNAICHHGLLDRNLAFIEKPFTPQALENKVREVLEAGSGAEAE
ncbi:MAG TPA: response regulator [Terriglobia bacterium]|nr:response regulator [Terriglobia bacterium]